MCLILFRHIPFQDNQKLNGLVFVLKKNDDEVIVFFQNCGLVCSKACPGKTLNNIAVLIIECNIHHISIPTLIKQKMP